MCKSGKITALWAPFTEFRVNLADAITGRFPCQREWHPAGIDANSLLALHSCSFVSIRGYMKAQFPDEETKSGEFKRQEDTFRECISNDRSTPYAAEAGRYHLYVSLACPWASRTFIVRKLKGLERAIGVTVVDPIRDERGWAFRKGPGYSKDPI